MGIIDKLINISIKGIECGNKMAVESMNRYQESYDTYSQRYAGLSNEHLKKEMQRFKVDKGRSSFAKIGRKQALKDEIINRKYHM